MTRAMYVVLYDGTCRICAAVARSVAALDVTGRTRADPLQAYADPFEGVTADVSAFRVVASDGRSGSGGDAVPLLLEALPMGHGLGRLVASSPSLQGLARRGYCFAVRFRGALTCGVAAPLASSTCP